MAGPVKSRWGIHYLGPGAGVTLASSPDGVLFSSRGIEASTEPDRAPSAALPILPLFYETNTIETAAIFREARHYPALKHLRKTTDRGQYFTSVLDRTIAEHETTWLRKRKRKKRGHG